MSRPTDTAFIRDELMKRLDFVVRKLWPNGYYDSELKRWRSGDVFDTEPRNNGSFMIDLEGSQKGLWYDHFAGEGGNLLQAMCQRNGGNWAETFNEARELLGIQPGQARTYSGPSPEQIAERDKRDRQQKLDDAAKAKRKSDWAKALWLSGAVLAPGDAAHLYFAGRGVDITRLKRPLNALRLTTCPHPHSGEVLPCLLAAVGGHGGWATHRTWLRPGVGAGGAPTVVKGYDKKRDGFDAKLSIAPIKGGHIPIQRGETGRKLQAAHPGERVIITEGIEDAVSIAVALPGERVICAVSGSNFGTVILPDAIVRVILAVDNDDVTDPDGKKAAKAAAQFAATGRRVEMWRPPEGVKDFNEILQREQRVENGSH